MIQTLQTIDERFFMFLNGLHCEAMDGIMYHASDPWCWRVWLIIFIGVRYRSTRYYLYLLIGLMGITSDLLSSHCIKEWAWRPRPSHVYFLGTWLLFRKRVFEK